MTWAGAIWASMAGPSGRRPTWIGWRGGGGSFVGSSPAAGAARVCAPSRAAFLTGKYSIHSGVRHNEEDLPAGEVTIAEATKPKGYTTALFGKWHRGRRRGGNKGYVHPQDQGFDEFFGYTDAVDAWEKFPATLWD